MEHNITTNEFDTAITIDSKSGLEAFAEHVDHIREEIESLQAEYHDRFEAIPPEFYTAGECYQTLRTLVLAALDELFTSDQVSDGLVDSLQLTYNQFSEVRDAMALLTAVGEEVSELLDAPDVQPLDVVSPSGTETGIVSPFFAVTPPADVAPEPIPPLNQKFTAHAKKPDTLFKKKAESKRPLELITEEVLANPYYRKVIEHYYGSPAVCEAALLREIEKRERPSKLDAVLGVTYKSTFHTFLKDLPLTEIAMLEEESSAVMRERVRALQIDYTIYVEWMKDLPVMDQLVRPHAAMTFADLYVRAELEILGQQLPVV